VTRPTVQFAVRYAAMQGPRSAAEVIEAVRALDADPAVDVLVIARGGGSVEDLLPFSDEGLLRVVSACRTPVVSAIGHDQDSPLLDLVADVRASTPTDAAKLLVPDVVEELARVRQARDRVRRAVVGRLDRERRMVADLRTRPVLADPRAGLVERRQSVRDLRDRGRRALGVRLEARTADLEHQRARVRSLSPLATLQRGYAVVRTAEGHLVGADAQPGVAVRIRVAGAELGATIDDVRLIEESTDE
jgi:exodeoxyribonuclease VII large subunit